MVMAGRLGGCGVLGGGGDEWERGGCTSRSSAALRECFKPRPWMPPHRQRRYSLSSSIVEGSSLPITVRDQPRIDPGPKTLDRLERSFKIRGYILRDSGE